MVNKMNNSIDGLVCFYDPFSYTQSIYEKSTDGITMRKIETVNEPSLVKTLVNKCQEQGIDKIYLYGNEQFLTHIVEKIKIYNPNMTKIGVNTDEILD